VSDAAPPPLPPLPPPPPLPPAPEGYAPTPVIRWGVGDIFWGLLLYAVGGTAVAVGLLVTGVIDADTVARDGTLGDLPVWAIALSVAGGWLGFIGWPIVATFRKGQRSLKLDFGLAIEWIDVAWGLLGGIAAVAFAAVGGLVWKLVTGEDSPGNGEFLPDNPAVWQGIVLWALIAVLTPIAEELFFRGLALRAIGRRWGLNVGIVASSLLFGLLHFDSAGGAVHGLFIVGVTAAYGAVFAVLVRRAGGRLGPSIVAHSVVNTVGVASLFLT
jgi:membrane protease YdiL (CAAX protease family)